MITVNTANPVQQFAFAHGFRARELSLLLVREPVTIARYLFSPTARNYLSPPQSVCDRISRLNQLSPQELDSFLETSAKLNSSNISVPKKRGRPPLVAA